MKRKPPVPPPKPPVPPVKPKQESPSKAKQEEPMTEHHSSHTSASTTASEPTAQAQSAPKPNPVSTKIVNAMAVAVGYGAVPESAAHRNNNPIAQSMESPTTQPPTATGSDGGMCVFASIDDGIRAALQFTKDLMIGKIPPYTADMKVSEFAATYWPQNPTGYAEALLKALNAPATPGGTPGTLSPDSKLSELPQ